MKFMFAVLTVGLFNFKIGVSWKLCPKERIGHLLLEAPPPGSYLYLHSINHVSFNHKCT